MKICAAISAQRLSDAVISDNYVLLSFNVLHAIKKIPIYNEEEKRTAERRTRDIYVVFFAARVDALADTLDTHVDRFDR